MNRLAGKVCLITGAARGQGALEAELFTQEGARVVLTDVDHEAGSRLAAGLKDAVYLPLDVSSESEWAKVVTATIERYGKLDVLVNNAGIYNRSNIVDTTVEAYTAIFKVNQLSVFLGMRAVIPYMKKSGGSIVNISSVAGMIGSAGAISYTSSKWAVRGMTKTAALELADYNIRVNSVHPGLIDTDMVRKGVGPERAHEITAGIPLGRVGTVAEAAYLVLYLASDESTYCTGSEFVVDGGHIAGRPPENGRMMSGLVLPQDAVGQRMAGKVGLVTGAAVGIGRAIAKRFAAEGMIVGVNDINANGTREVVQEILAAGGQAIALTMDIGQRDRMHEAVNTLAQKFGRFDVMVNNAAWVHYEAIPSITEDSFARMMSAGFASVTWGTQAAAAAMGEQGGAIVNIASGASFLGLTNAMIYCGIKSGVLGLTRAAAVELGPRKIRVNALAPGPTWSPTTAAVLSPEKAQNRADRTPLRRIGEPEDVARAAFFLADSESSFVNGAVISVDGGITFAYQ